MISGCRSIKRRTEKIKEYDKKERKKKNVMKGDIKRKKKRNTRRKLDKVCRVNGKLERERKSLRVLYH